MAEKPKVAVYVYRVRRTDKQINACCHDTGSGDCQICPDNTRCLELFEQELARHLGTEPPEEV